MGKIRKPFQGVFNIIRFNWHFYIIAVALILALILLTNNLVKPLQMPIYVLCSLITLSTIISLFVSFYIYDLSGLYGLKWIGASKADKLIVNINAGFDETSVLLKNSFKNAEIVSLDFYDPIKHTEVSIKRARKAYTSYPNPRQVTTDDLQLADNSADKIFVIFSAHEIRDKSERILFFKELKRVIKPDGQIYLTEHLRDTANFLAYNIGFLHFYSKTTWLNTFQVASLTIKQEMKITPFISTFILTKNGNTL
jgi:ubiquinone/menaquinone biosynthesis C-methylase UbiE